MPLYFALRLKRFTPYVLLMAGVAAVTGCHSPTPSAAPGTGETAAAAARYAIHYPTLSADLAPLDQAMHAYAQAMQRDFDAAVAQHRNSAEVPTHLTLEFTIATRSQDFVSAEVRGEAAIGESQPRPIQASFTQHLPSGRIVALTDLFSDADSVLKALSDEARRRFEAEFEARLRAENLPAAQLADGLKAMRQVVEKGTAPEAANFALFVIDGVDGKAIGLRLQFPSERIALPADGIQRLEVPARVFYAQLKPEYRSAFAVDDDVRATPMNVAAPKPAPAVAADGAPQTAQ
jgi:hypothetical protein